MIKFKCSNDECIHEASESEVLSLQDVCRIDSKFRTAALKRIHKMAATNEWLAEDFGKVKEETLDDFLSKNWKAVSQGAYCPKCNSETLGIVEGELSYDLNHLYSGSKITDVKIGDDSGIPEIGFDTQFPMLLPGVQALGRVSIDWDKKGKKDQYYFYNLGLQSSELDMAITRTLNGLRENLQPIREGWEELVSSKTDDEYPDIFERFFRENNSFISALTGQKSHYFSSGLVKKIEVMKREPHHDRITKIYGPPGTGKTTTLIGKLKEKIASGVEPKDVGFFSFTNFSTEVAKKKVVEEFPEYELKKDFLGFKTLHSLAYQALPEKIDLLTPEQATKFYDGFRTEEVWLEADNPDSVVVRVKQIVIDAASVARSKRIDLKEYLYGLNDGTSYRLKRWLGYEAKKCGGPLSRRDVYILNDFVERFEEYKKSLNAIDYTSILELALENESSVPSYKVVFIDEAQDLSKLQWLVAEMLFKKAEVIYVAGDDKQAICESFGAEPALFVQYPHGYEIKLEQSYRVPIAVHDELFSEEGIIGKITKLFVSKLINWNAKSSVDSDGIYRKLSGKTLPPLIKEFPDKEWLIMAAVHSELESLSYWLDSENIPHLLKNKLVTKNKVDVLPNITLATIWGAKGGEADIAVLLKGDFVGDKMLEEDPRLQYVAYTRTENVLLTVDSNLKYIDFSLDELRSHIRKLDSKAEKDKKKREGKEKLRSSSGLAELAHNDDEDLLAD